MYLSIDVDAVLGLEAKRHVAEMLRTDIRNAREQLCQTGINVLAHYRKVVSGSTTSTQFVLPETMKVYPLLILGMMKTPAFRYLEELRIDSKVASMSQLLSASFSQLITRVYPRMYSVSQLIDPAQPYGTLIPAEENGVAPSSAVFKPLNMPASVERMAGTDAYLICNSDFIYFYVPNMVGDEIIKNVCPFC